MLDLICGKTKATAGSIKFRGRELTKLSEHAIVREGVGRKFQTEAGDLLVVDILGIGAFENSQWGFNGFFSKQNGGRFLTEHFPEAQKSIWDFNGMFTKSRHVPGVEFAGLIHPGLIGCRPSAELLKEWNSREKALYDADPERVPALATLPYAETAHMGELKGSDRDHAAAEGARTVPPVVDPLRLDCRYRCCGCARGFLQSVLWPIIAALQTRGAKSSPRTLIVDASLLGDDHFL